MIVSKNVIEEWVPIAYHWCDPYCHNYLYAMVNVDCDSNLSIDDCKLKTLSMGWMSILFDSRWGFVAYNFAVSVLTEIIWLLLNFVTFYNNIEDWHEINSTKKNPISSFQIRKLQNFTKILIHTWRIAQAVLWDQLIPRQSLPQLVQWMNVFVLIVMWWIFTDWKCYWINTNSLKWICWLCIFRFMPFIIITIC